MNPSVEWARQQNDETILSASYTKESLAQTFQCIVSEIAINIEEISPDTKVYIGPWSVATHRVLSNAVEHVYDQTLENKVFRQTIELTARTSGEYLEAFDMRGIHIRDWTKDNMLFMLTPLKKKETVNLVSFSVSNLGLPDGVRLQEIYARAQELGLGLCDLHVGPELRLALKEQPANSFYRIAMKPVIKPGGREVVFGVDRLSDATLWLDRDGGEVDGTWYGSHVFVFVSAD